MPTETYKVVRFRSKGNRRVIQRGLSLEEAQRHCRREDTHKKDSQGNVIWFDGYEKE